MTLSGHQQARIGIDARDVRPLSLVAMKAAPGKVLQHSCAAVLSRDNVIGLEGQGIERIRHSAVIATPAGEARFIHVAAFFLFGFPSPRSVRRAFDCKMPSV
jgi:hypothetical protein